MKEGYSIFRDGIIFGPRRHHYIPIIPTPKILPITSLKSSSNNHPITNNLSQPKTQFPILINAPRAPGPNANPASAHTLAAHYRRLDPTRTCTRTQPRISIQLPMHYPGISGRKSNGRGLKRHTYSFTASARAR